MEIRMGIRMRTGTGMRVGDGVGNGDRMGMKWEQEPRQGSGLSKETG